MPVVLCCHSNLALQEMLRKSKKDDSGVKLEVNGRILDSCTELMAVGEQLRILLDINVVI